MLHDRQRNDQDIDTCQPQRQYSQDYVAMASMSRFPGNNNNDLIGKTQTELNEVVLTSHRLGMNLSGSGNSSSFL